MGRRCRAARRVRPAGSGGARGRRGRRGAAAYRPKRTPACSVSRPGSVSIGPTRRPTSVRSPGSREDGAAGRAWPSAGGARCRSVGLPGRCPRRRFRSYSRRRSSDYGRVGPVIASHHPERRPGGAFARDRPRGSVLAQLVRLGSSVRFQIRSRRWVKSVRARRTCSGEAFVSMSKRMVHRIMDTLGVQASG
jgi:hypothetical protein